MIYYPYRPLLFLFYFPNESGVSTVKYGYIQPFYNNLFYFYVTNFEIFNEFRMNLCKNFTEPEQQPPNYCSGKNTLPVT